MKKNDFIFLAMLGMVLAFGMAVTGCDLSKTDDSWTFVNNSSYDVKVMAIYLNWDFTVDAGTTKTVESKANPVQFSYRPANSVSCTQDNRKFTFTNK
jgi:hypothetical protein